MLSHLRLTGLAVGFHAVAHLTPDADEAAIVRAALERGVGLHGMSTYRSDRSAHPPPLVFGFGNTSAESIHAGLDLVTDLLR